MMEDIHKITDGKMRNPCLGFQCCIEVGRDLWFSSFHGNGLFRLHGQKVEHILDFEEEGVKLFNDIKSYRGKLYFIPLTADRIYVYDPAGGGMEGIPYEKRGISAFVFSIVYGHYLYMFPSYYRGILKLDMDTCGTEIIDSWISEDLEKCRLSDDAYFRGDYVRKGDVLYLPLCNAHAVLEFGLDDGSSVIHDVGNQGYATIVDDGKRFWMAPRRKGNIVRWDVVTGETEEYSDFPEGFRQGSFLGSFYRDGHIWMFPENTNMVLKVNSHTGEMTEDTRFSDFCNHKISKFSVWDASFVYMGKKEDEVLLCAGKSGEVVRFYPDRDEVGRFRLMLSGEDEKYYPAVLDKYADFRKSKIKKLLSGLILKEGRDYSLEEYIEYIDSVDAEKSCGHACAIGAKNI